MPDQKCHLAPRTSYPGGATSARLENMKRIVAAILGRLSWSRPYLALSRAADRLVVWRSRFERPIEDNFDHVIVPTRGRGNIGDQAMLDSFLENVHGDVLVVLDRVDDFSIPSERIGRTHVLELPHFIYGRPRHRIRSRRRLFAHLRAASTFTVVGADVMDGGYNRRESVLRSHLVRAAAEIGVKSQLLGFSWNSNPDPSAARALALATRVARANVRDPESVRRLQSRGIDRIHPVADSAFLLSTVRLVPEFRDWAGAGSQPVALVNTSGLIARFHDFTGEYIEIIQGLSDLGYRVVLLPHVIRLGDNDLDVARMVAASTGNSDLLLIDRLLSPAEVSYVASQASIVVTGRMHLAILTLSHAVPAIVLATQGKVDGLLELFSLKDLSIEPRAGFGAIALNKARWCLEHSDEVRSRVTVGRDRARSLARDNFAITAGLG